MILQGVSFKENILFADESQDFAKAFPSQVRFVACLSREKETVGANTYCGRVQTLFHELQLQEKEDVVYLCGNPSMIDEAFQYLQEKGFASQDIVREKYISR
jgi:NAD(P)H-flavin reductase